MPAPPSPRCSRLPPRHRARTPPPRDARPSSQMPAPVSSTTYNRLRNPRPRAPRVGACDTMATPATPLRNPRPRARSLELRRAPALAPDTMMCPTLNLATTPSTTTPSFLATTPSLDGRRDWWHLPDLGACLIFRWKPGQCPVPLSRASMTDIPGMSLCDPHLLVVGGRTTS
jgi:hypothetical protein